MKELKDISLNITEEEYRNDGAMHYSTLAGFERGGFHAIPTLTDRKESPSLLFGSLVDTILTDGMKAFNEQYYVCELPEISNDSFLNITKGFFNNLYKNETTKEKYPSLDAIPNSIILSALNDIGYGRTWRAETRLSKYREQCREYYRQMFIAGNRIIVSNTMYSDAINAVNAIKTSPLTSILFADNTPFDDWKRYYQLKFSAYVKYNINTHEIISIVPHNSKDFSKDLESQGYIRYSCMMDLVLVNDKTKTIVPCDLKTSSHYEDEFYKSFVDWTYDIQAREYAALLRAVMNTDEQFNSYKLQNYLFIVVNKKNLIPLVWRYGNTYKRGTLYYGKNNQIEFKDPFELGVELNNYVLTNAKIPSGITREKPNDLIQYLNTL